VPLVGELLDLIWYGILYTITTQIVYMTPPFGYNRSLCGNGPARNHPSRYLFIDHTFVLIMVLALALVMVFPGTPMWLRNYVYN
jgi:TRAP-type mannitol/chloroaromatic compound transport system permease large subunit